MAVPRVRAGKLRERVVLQTLGSTQNTDGEQIKAWTNTAHLWAQIEPLTGRELSDAQQITETVSTKITIRARQLETNQRFLVPRNQHDASLATAIANTTSTGLAVTRAIGWSAGEFAVRLGSEYGLVQSGNGTTAMTFSRSAYGTSATTHSTGALVRVYEALDIESSVNIEERGVSLEIMCSGRR